MIWTQNDNEWNPVCIDGYLPERKKLVDVFNKLYGEDYILKNKIPAWSATELFLGCASDLSVEYRIEHKLKCLGCELTALAFENEKPVLPPFTHFYNEFLFEKHKEDYCIVIMVPLEKRHLHHCPECMKSVITDLDFRSKYRKEYKDYRTFANRMNDLMYVIAEPYRHPSLAVQNKMTTLGFKSIRF